MSTAPHSTVTAQQLDLDQMQDRVQHMELAFTEANSAMLELANKLAQAIEYQNQTQGLEKTKSIEELASALQKMDGLQSQMDLLATEISAPFSTLDEKLQNISTEVGEQNKILRNLVTQVSALTSDSAKENPSEFEGYESEKDEKGGSGKELLPEKKLDALLSSVQRIASAIESRNQSAAHEEVPDHKAVPLKDEMVEALCQVLNEKFDIFFQLDEKLVALFSKIEVGLLRIDHLDEIKTQLNAALNRPNPVIDLAPQRKLLAKFASALARATNRIDQAASQISEKSKENISQVLEHSDKIDRSITSLQPTLEHAIGTQLAKLGIIPEAWEKIETKIENLRTRPIPSVDFSSQTKTLARFSRVLTRAVDRIQEVSEGTSLPNSEVCSEKNMDHSDQRMEISQSTPTYEYMQEKMERVEFALSEIDKKLEAASTGGPAGHSANFIAHQSFARFKSVNEGILRRMTRLMDAIEEGYNKDQSAEAAEISSNLKEEVIACFEGHFIKTLSDLAHANRVLAEGMPLGAAQNSVGKGLEGADIRTLLAECVAQSIKTET